MLTDSFICEVTCSAHMSDHLPLVTNNLRMGGLFLLHDPFWWFVQVLSQCWPHTATASSNFQCPKSYLPLSISNQNVQETVSGI